MLFLQMPEQCNQTVMSGRILIGLLLLLALRLASVAIIAFWGETGALGWAAEALARKNELRLSETGRRSAQPEVTCAIVACFWSIFGMSRRGLVLVLSRSPADRN